MNYSISSTPLLAETIDKSGTHDKSGTKTRRKSIIADGDFVNKLQAIGYFPPTKRRPYYVVGGSSLSPLSLPCTHPLAKQPKTKPWRDTGEEVRGLFYHAALSSYPNVKAFTLMLSKPVEALARSQGSQCLAWLHRRFVKHLRACGDAVPFWFVIEESEAGRLHIHGEISIGQIDSAVKSVRVRRRALEPIRSALKAAGGKWEGDRDGEGRQLRFSPGKPDFRWAGYCLKSVHKARPVRRRFMSHYGSPWRWVAGFEGKAVTASEALKAAAISMHRATFRPRTA